MYNPLDMTKLAGVTTHNTLEEAQEHLNSLAAGGGVIIAIQTNVEDWREEMGSGNFATFFGTHWEYANHGGEGMKIIHSPELPQGYKYEVFFVVPRQ
jgi:hypothetical protein